MLATLEGLNMLRVGFLWFCFVLIYPTSLCFCLIYGSSRYHSCWLRKHDRTVDHIYDSNGKGPIKNGVSSATHYTNRTGGLWPVFRSSLTSVWGKEMKQNRSDKAVTAHLKKCGKGKDSL